MHAQAGIEVDVSISELEKSLPTIKFHIIIYTSKRNNYLNPNFLIEV
jgi:hypothetical protein